MGLDSVVVMPYRDPSPQSIDGAFRTGNATQHRELFLSATSTTYSLWYAASVNDGRPSWLRDREN